MNIVSKTVSLTGLTIRLNQKDLHDLDELLNILHSATKQNAYGIVKDLAGDLQNLIDHIADNLPNTKGKREDSHEEDGGNNMSPKNMSPKKRPKNAEKAAASGLVKVSINNLDDNCVLHAAIILLNEFVSNNTIPVEAYIKQNKGVYVTEEELDRLLDKILAYNIKHENTPLSITIGE